MNTIQPISALFLVVLDLLNMSYTLFCPTGTPTPPPAPLVVLYLSNPFPCRFREAEGEEGANLASGNFFPALILSTTLPSPTLLASQLVQARRGMTHHSTLTYFTPFPNPLVFANTSFCILPAESRPPVFLPLPPP